MRTRNRVRVIDQNALNRVRDWQDHIRDPSLTALLVLELCAIFFAAPLAARGVPVARPVADALVLAVLVVVVLLSHRWLAITLILIGVTAIGASILPHPQWSPLPGAGLQRGGDIIVFLALIWVVAHAVYAPGRITFHRLQGAMVLYLSVATLFAAAYGLIWEMSPDAFAHLGAPKTEPQERASMLYFSLSTLTTQGYGDIVAVDPLARSLTNLEAVIGQFFLAITVARLVTLELQDRRK